MTINIWCFVWTYFRSSVIFICELRHKASTCNPYSRKPAKLWMNHLALKLLIKSSQNWRSRLQVAALKTTAKKFGRSLKLQGKKNQGLVSLVRLERLLKAASLQRGALYLQWRRRKDPDQSSQLGNPLVGKMTYGKMLGGWWQLFDEKLHDQNDLSGE